MELKHAWMWYCQERFPDPNANPAPEPVSPMQALSLLSDLQPMFTARIDMIEATPYNTAFDNEADNMLLHLARFDDLSAWENGSAGAWRVLTERLRLSVSMLRLDELDGKKVIGQLPSGLDRRSKARAVMLVQLGNRRSDVPPEWLPKQGHEQPAAIPDFPADWPLKKQ